jgi:SagB-type dehydrogenase family enzyme
VVKAVLVQALELLASWISPADFSRRSGMSRAAARTWLERLTAYGVLERARVPVEHPATAWDTWGEAAAFLHFSTRNQTFLDQPAALESLRAAAAAGPPPAPTKAYDGRRRLALPRVSCGPRSFEDVTRARRTWRRFGAGRPSLADLAAVLGLTFEAQRWVDLGAAGRAMLRSSPSGGGRHPTEAYVMVRAIRGVRQGFYYYAPAEHALVPIAQRRVTGAEITRLLVGQDWYAGASVVVFLTAVFERAAWVYDHPRAYKSILLEAGHFCQTFCLAATARRLAPFCTAAFADAAVERTLGLDSLQESVVYATGFGLRPPRTRWAPWPRGERHASAG